MADPAETSATPHDVELDMELPDKAGLLAGAANHGWVGDEGADASLEGIPMRDRSVVAAAQRMRSTSMRSEPPPKRDLTLEMWKGTIMVVMALEHVNMMWNFFFLPDNLRMGYNENWTRPLKPIVPVDLTFLGVFSFVIRSVVAPTVITGFTFLLGVGIQLLIHSRQNP
ncbi:hypothetical protein T484DRAFT_1899265 [Baffinella frigidus]|nr:hypothetical protein T484DRAFT_1899265 [Cryptophyta sp. CCMP2293]